jgi:hypothetical protein
VHDDVYAAALVALCIARGGGSDPHFVLRRQLFAAAVSTPLCTVQLLLPPLAPCCLSFLCGVCCDRVHCVADCGACACGAVCLPHCLRQKRYLGIWRWSATLATAVRVCAMYSYHSGGLCGPCRRWTLRYHRAAPRAILLLLLLLLDILMSLRRVALLSVVALLARVAVCAMIRCVVSAASRPSDVSSSRPYDAPAIDDAGRATGVCACVLLGCVFLRCCSGALLMARCLSLLLPDVLGRGDAALVGVLCNLLPFQR